MIAARALNNGVTRTVYGARARRDERKKSAISSDICQGRFELI
jgi:hypothetical protein